MWWLKTWHVLARKKKKTRVLARKVAVYGRNFSSKKKNDSLERAHQWNVPGGEAQWAFNLAKAHLQRKSKFAVSFVAFCGLAYVRKKKLDDLCGHSTWLLNLEGISCGKWHSCCPNLQEIFVSSSGVTNCAYSLPIIKQASICLLMAPLDCSIRLTVGNAGGYLPFSLLELVMHFLWSASFVRLKCFMPLVAGILLDFFFHIAMVMCSLWEDTPLHPTQQTGVLFINHSF